jgi:hypothetical protein
MGDFDAIQSPIKHCIGYSSNSGIFSGFLISLCFSLDDSSVVANQNPRVLESDSRALKKQPI